MTGSAQVIPVGRATERHFLGVPEAIYRGSYPAWSPPAPGEERRLFDPARNPALGHCEGARWVAVREGQCVGRVAAFRPADGGAVGYFGFFESRDDPGAARALLEAAEAWLEGRGCSDIYGPVAVHPRDQIGLLTEGYDTPATLLTPYNPPYYRRLLEGAGYAAVIGLRAYAWRPGMADARGVLELEAAVARRSRVRIRPLDPRRLPAEALLVADLVNRSLSSTWGYVPITKAEAGDLARQLRPVLDPGICLIAEEPSGPCAVALSVPDVNWLLRRIRGRLWPLGWLHALRLRRRIPGARLMVLAILPGRRTGLLLRLMAALHHAWLAGGYRYAELSQVFDDNLPMRRVLDRAGFPVVKRWAVFRRQPGERRS